MTRQRRYYFIGQKTKSVSVVPDSVSEDDLDDISVDSQNSPVFRVQAPHSFSTEYPGDESVAFTSQGLVEVDKLGSSQSAAECSEELISDPDNLLGRCDDMDVTKTFVDENTVGSTNLPKDAGNILFLVDNSDSTKTFSEDDSLMDLDKMLVRSDDHESKMILPIWTWARHQTREHILIPNIVHLRKGSRKLQVMNLHVISLVMVKVLTVRIMLLKSSHNLLMNLIRRK